jgi:hypothetical protein
MVSWSGVRVTEVHAATSARLFIGTARGVE